MGTIFDAKSPSFTLGIRPSKPTDPRQHLDGLSARYQVPANLLQAMGEAQGDAEFSGAEDNARAVAAALKGGASMSQALELAAGSPERAQAIKARANALMDATQPDDQRRGPKVESGPSLVGDLARMVGGGLVRGVGGGIEGIGIAAEDATMARKEGHEGEFRRFARRLGDKVRGAGDSIQAGVSDRMREAMADSTPTGDLLAPSTYSLGENPSLRGYAGHAASVLGSLLPVVATAVVTRSPAATAAAGGFMGGGEGAEQGRQIVMDAADKVDDQGQPVLMSSEVYRRALESGATHEQAVEATANEAARVGALFQMPVSALGGGLTQKIVAPAERAVGRGVVRGVVGRGALSGGEEGVQEATESMAAQAGTNRVTGLDDSLTEGTFGDFILGALGGAGPGAVSGAFDGRAAREQGQSAGEGAPGQADAAGPQPHDGGQGPTLALPPPPRALPPPRGLPAPDAASTGDATLTENPDSAQGRAPDGAAVPSPNPQQAGGGTAQPAIDQFRPAGLLESLATTMPPPPTAPVEAHAPLFPDMKPGAAVELGGPMGVTMPAVFLREEGGNVVVRIEGREVPFTPAEFDASRQAAVVAREQAESERQNPLVPTDDPQAAAPQQMEPAHVEPASPADAVAGGLSAGPVRVDDVRQDGGQGTATGRVDRSQGAQGDAALDAGRGRADPAEDRQGDLGGLDVADGAGNLDGAVTPAPSEADQLRERLAFLKRLGRTNGWNSRMSRARADVERELRRLEGPPPSIARVRGRARAAVLRDWNEAEPPAVDGVTLKHDSTAGGWIFSRSKEAKVREALGIAEAAPATAPTPEDVRIAAAEVNIEPTEAQKEAGNYRLGHLRWHGLGISIETPRGATRSGKDADGNPWSVKMPADYGYLKRTEGADGDHLDIYMGPQPDAGQVFVVDQVDAETGAFDEHKVMLGFPDRDAALSAYRAAFSDGKGDARMGGVTEMTAEGFRDAARDGDWSQPLAAPVPAKQAELADVSTKPTDFVQAPDGSIDFGEIGADVAGAIGRQPGPIRLREGDKSTGLAHISRPQRLAEIRQSGEETPEGFVARVAGDFDAIYKGRGRSLFVVRGAEKPNQTLVVQLEPDAQGDFYDVKTAIVSRSTFWRGKEMLWERAPTNQTAEGDLPSAISGQSDSEDSASAPGNQSSPTPEAPASAKIEDFGETLEGARKHVWAVYADTLKSAEEADVASVPLSKSWPAPDYQKLIEAGVEPWKVGFIRAARDTIPTKPQKAWRLKGWVEAVEAMRGLAADVLDGQHDAESLRAHLRRNGGAGATILGQMDLYEAVGHAISLKGMNLHRVEYTMLAGVRFDPPRAFWEIDQKARATAFSNMPKTIARAETREGAIEAFKQRHADMAKAEAAAPATKQRKFVAYRHDGGKYFSVGTRIGSRYIQLRRTDSVKEARRIIAEEHEALQAQFDAMREIPADRRSENAPRVGIDHRSGADVTPEQFGEAFGFRGVQFGNWVEGGRRQQDLNDAFDALMDLAGVLDLPPRALSLHGTLGLAFGARGRGGMSPASAHYEPGQVVINLTKTSGAGSLAHEWFHALDNYFARRIEARMCVAPKGLEYASDNSTPGKDVDGVRPEVVDAFLVLKRALGATGLAARSKNIDQMRAKPYWATGIEMHARAFESYVIAKLQDQSIANDYLANIVDGVAWQMRAELSGLGDSYPYLTEAEIETVRPAFDGLFEVIETRETEQGVELYQHEMEEGPFGPVIGGYEGDWRGAALALEEMQTGEAPGALSHPEIGPIALVWGNKGTRHSDGFGLSKLIAYHPEMLDDLQGRLERMEVVSRSANRVRLRGVDDQADVRLTWDNEVKTWLLGGYDRNAPRRTEESTARLRDLWGDRAPSPRRGKENDTTDGGRVQEQREQDGRREAGGFSSSTVPKQAGTSAKHGGLAEGIVGGESASVDTRAMRGLAETVNAILAAHGLRGGVMAKVVRTLMTASGVRVLGAYRNGTISVNATASRPGHVVRHEIIHALRDAALWGKPYGLFNRQEWLALVRAARKDPVISARVAQHYGDASATVQTEEMVAELYADWATRRAEAPPGALGAALERIQSFFRAIAAALRGEGFIDAAAVMRRIERGEIGGREAGMAQGRGDGTARYQRNPVSLESALIGGDLASISAHPDYPAAKAGDVDAAMRLAQGIVTDDLVQKVRNAIGKRRPVVVPVASVEASGRNKIPPIVAVVLAHRLGLEAEGGIVQANAPRRTSLSGLERIFASPEFDGPVIAGQDYLILDDTLTQGGTFAALIGHIEAGGGRVVGAVALTGKQYSAKLRPSDATLSALREKHGDLEQDFRAATGYGFDSLTESEARYLTNFKPAEAVRNRILAERDARGDGAGEGADPSVTRHQRDMGETAAAQLRATGSWANGMLGQSGWLSPAQWPERISNKMTDWMGRTPSMAGLALVPGRALFTELGRNIRAAGIYQRLKEEMDAQRNEWQAKAADVAKAWSIQRGRYPKENEAMMDLMHAATLEQVDPAQPFEPSERAGWAEDIVRRGIIGGARKVAQDIIERDRVRKAAYDRLRPRYEALPDGLKGIYRTVRDSYTRLADEVDAAVLDSVKVATEIAVKRAERAHAADLRRITEDGLNGTERATAIALADKRRDDAKARARGNAEKRSSGLRAAFEANRKAGPYFPLARFGRYFVAIKDAEEKITSFSRFDSKQAQADFIKQAKADGLGPIVEDGIIGEDDIKGMVDPQFVAEVERIMADAGTSEETMDAVWQAWLSTLPDQSIRKNRIHRKGRAGYDADAYRAFGKQMFHGAHQLARLKHGMRMEDALNDAEEQARRMEDPARAGFVVEEMRRRHAFTMNPTGSAAASTLTGIGFIWYLGMTPAAALVNISQTTMLGVPMMAQRYKKAGVTGAIRALTGATRDFAAGKGKAENSARLTADEKAAMVEAYRRGTVDKTQSHDLAGVAESGVEHSVRREKIMAAFSFMFHHAERLNRETTFLASYRLAREQGLDHEAAIEDASHLTWKAHFSYANNDRPRVIQNDFAKVLLLFRQYTINMLWRLFRDAHQSFAGATKEDRAEARTQLIGISLSMMAHAGIKGVWGYALIMSMLGMFFPGGDDDAERWLQDALLLEGDDMGTAAWNWIATAALIGVPGKVTGADVSGRIGMPELWFRDNGRDLDGQDAWRATLEDLAGPVAGIAGGFAKALGSMGEDPWRATEAAMPKFARDLMKTGRYAGEGVLTWNGDPVVENVSIRELAMQAIGITPGRLSAQYEANNRMRNENDRISAEKKRLHRRLGDALSSGNGIDAGLREALLDFNRRHYFDTITVETLRQSMQMRQRASQRNEGGVGFTPKRDAYLRSREGQLVW